MPPGLGVLRGPAALSQPEPRRERPQSALAEDSGWGFSWMGTACALEEAGSSCCRRLSIFELRGRETNRLDEKMIFDALKLNSDVIRSTGLPKPKSQAEKREHRRSWRMFVPANFMDYANKSESSFVEPTEVSDAVTKASKCKWGTNSQTSEEDDSGLYSPPAEKEEKQGPGSGDQPQTRSLSSAEDIHISEPYRPLYSADSVSEQKIPLLSCRSAHPGDSFQVIWQGVSPLEGNTCEIEVTQKKCSLQFIPVKKKTGPRKTGVQAGTLDTVCNGFQVFQKEEIEALQVKQQDVNWLGQGLIQSAAANTCTQGLEHDLDDVNARWKTLNKK
ncbi:hypothetical protein U0070_021905, partial [Myodes glareolus]